MRQWFRQSRIELKTQISGLTLAFAIGLAGGAGADWIGAPLPWFIGPMVLTALFAIAGAPIRSPNFLRPMALPILGAVLGSAFMPSIFANVAAWALSLSMIPLFILLSTVLSFAYFRLVARKDFVTSYLSSVPGGFNDMILMGEEKGGDARQIALAHSMRVLVSVVGIALFLVLTQDATGDATARPFTRFEDVAPVELVLLLVCVALGPTVGRVLRLPAAPILGALLLSATAHLVGWLHTPPPTLLSLAAQLVMGTGIGARFAGMSISSAAASMGHGAASAVIATAVSAFTAFLAVVWAGLDFNAALLGYAPGGLMEMSLLAVAVHQSVAYVTIAHTLRYVLIMFTAFLIFHAMHRRQ